MAIIVANDSNFNQLLASNKVVVAKFYADWCGSCKLFAPKFNRVSNEEAHSDVAFIDVDAENNPETRKAAGVDNLPFLAVFREGKLIEGSSGSKEEYLRSLIEKGKNE